MIENVEKFKAITEEMVKLYEVKNKNYGNSFDKSLDEDGLLVSKIRLGDKLGRFSSLLKANSIGTKDESIEDTLIDLANYAVMTLKWMRNKKQNSIASTESGKISDLYSNTNNVNTTISTRNKIGYR